jgi:hypothetical protein
VLTAFTVLTALTELTALTVLTAQTQIHILCIRIIYIFRTILKTSSNHFPENFNSLTHVMKDFFYSCNESQRDALFLKFV